MNEEEERLQRKKVVRWLAIGTGVIAVIIAAMLTIGAFSDAQAEQVEKATVSEEDLEGAKQFATDFITEAGTFGLSQEAIDGQAFDMAKSFVAANKGAYNNPAFGLSRGERYSDLMQLIDPNGALGNIDYFADELNSYYPDWTGQLLSYSASDVLLTPGEAYREDGSVRLPVQVSFTSNVSLFSDDNVSTATGDWQQYTSQEFVTVELTLSQQPLGSWRVWDISDPTTNPYVLATWQEPNWKIASPNKAVMTPVE